MLLIRPVVLFISQIFALLPVSNVLSSNVQHLRYRWLSWRTLYAAIVMLLNCLEFSTILYLVSKFGVNFHTSGSFSFYIVCVLEHVFFWRLAIRWPSIMQTWRQTEEIFLRPPYRVYATFNMKKRIYIFTSILVCSALIEHWLFVFNSFKTSSFEHDNCELNTSVWENLYRHERPHLHAVMPFKAWLLPFIEWINLTLAYPRSYTDAFIICISTGFAARFHQLHLRIEAVHTKALPSLFWTEVREHHLQLKRLLRLVNDEIAPLILLACTNNMYFICFQLFNSFQDIGVNKNFATAFWYSLVFAIARTALTLYIASTINQYSKAILSVLRCVPSKYWCLEIQRFSEQLAIDLYAFSGCGFFFMTRKLMLAMASSIVTYELMVIDVVNKGTTQKLTDYCARVQNEEVFLEDV